MGRADCGSNRVSGGDRKSEAISTLGERGSDTSAVALAASLNADECLIYTDVDGVYTTDPRIEPEARRLNEITLRNARNVQLRIQGVADKVS